MKVCQHCQTEVKEGDLFCGNCGKKHESEVTSVEKSTTRTSEQSVDGVSATEHNAEQPTTNEASTAPIDTTTIANSKQGVVKQGKKLPLFYLLLIVVGIGVGVFYLFTKDGTSIIPQAGSPLKTDGKEKVAVSDIIDDVAFTLSATADGLSYDLYAVQEKVIEREDTEGIDAGYGDVLETSDIVFYLAEQGAQSAYRQSQIEPFEMVRNLTSENWSEWDWYEELTFPDYSLIALYKYFDIFSYREIHLFDVIDGELVKVNLNDFRYSYYYPHIKSIDEDKIQLVILEESFEDRWFFDTYEYDRSLAMMYLYNEKTFDAFDVFEYPIAEIIFEYWEVYDDAYVPFTKEVDKRIWDLKRVVKNAEDGRLGSMAVKLGDSMGNVYRKYKAFSDIDIIGIPYLGFSVEIHYDTFTVGFEPADPNFEVFEGEVDIEFEGTVTSLKIPGEYTTFTIEEVETTLGRPDQFFDSYDTPMNYDYYGYYMNDYTLVFVADQFDDIVEVVLIPWDLVDYLGF